VLGGVLARMTDMDADDIERFVSAIARVAGDEEADERGHSAVGAVDLLKRRKPTPGLPRMREVWGNEVANTVAEWLNINRGPSGSYSADDERTIDALAKLTPIEYDRHLKTVAKQLGVRSKTLDREVTKRRDELAIADTATPLLQAPDPWPETGRRQCAPWQDLRSAASTHRACGIVLHSRRSVVPARSRPRCCTAFPDLVRVFANEALRQDQYAVHLGYDRAQTAFSG
jgi:hypothetical protein